VRDRDKLKEPSSLSTPCVGCPEENGATGWEEFGGGEEQRSVHPSQRLFRSSGLWVRKEHKSGPGSRWASDRISAFGKGERDWGKKRGQNSEKAGLP